MLTPIKLLLIGVVVFAIGFAFGAFNIDPLSAWIGTAGMAIAAVALLWLVLARIRTRRNA
jgi:hypothetical protein